MIALVQILAWRVPWTEEPGGLQSMGSCPKSQDTTEQLHFHFSLSCIGEGNGNPLQCSCLENPRDGGAWWAAVSGVTQSRTRLKRLSSSSSSSAPSPSRRVFILSTFAPPSPGVMPSSQQTLGKRGMDEQITQLRWPNHEDGKTALCG